MGVNKRPMQGYDKESLLKVCGLALRAHNNLEKNSEQDQIDIINMLSIVQDKHPNFVDSSPYWIQCARSYVFQESASFFFDENRPNNV
jgi:hypothetical protein